MSWTHVFLLLANQKSLYDPTWWFIIIDIFFIISGMRSYFYTLSNLSWDKETSARLLTSPIDSCLLECSSQSARAWRGDISLKSANLALNIFLVAQRSLLFPGHAWNKKTILTAFSTCIRKNKIKKWSCKKVVEYSWTPTF